MLHSLGVLSYSPPLDGRIRRSEPLDVGGSWEVQLRGCSIWAVELIRRQISREHPEAEVNAVLIDFFLYDLTKEREASGESTPLLTCHTGEVAKRHQLRCCSNALFLHRTGPAARARTSHTKCVHEDARSTSRIARSRFHDRQAWRLLLTPLRASA